MAVVGCGADGGLCALEAVAVRRVEGDAESEMATPATKHTKWAGGIRSNSEKKTPPETIVSTVSSVWYVGTPYDTGELARVKWRKASCANAQTTSTARLTT